MIMFLFIRTLLNCFKIYVLAFDFDYNINAMHPLVLYTLFLCILSTLVSQIIEEQTHPHLAQYGFVYASGPLVVPIIRLCPCE